MKNSDRVELTKEILYDLYINQKLTIKDISEKTGWSSGYISNRINLYSFRRSQIKVKRNPPNKIYIDEEILRDEYLNKKTKIKDIAKILGVCQTSIMNKLKELGILRLRKKMDLLQDLKGRHFGTLKVLKFSGDYTKIQERLWLCQCKVCGENKKVRTSKLISGEVQSCGKKSCKKRRFNGYGEVHGYHWEIIKRAAKDRGINVNVTIEDVWDLFLKQDRKCALSGLELTLKKSLDGISKTASLDRIDSEGDYDYQNIQWIHKLINRMKGDLNQKEFIKLCGLIWEYSKWQLNVCS